MRFSTEWCQEKTLSSGAKIIEGKFKDMAGEYHEATIWEKDRNGVVFPNFALVGKEAFEGELWTSPSSGKKTIYPPKEKKATGGSRMAMMEKAQEKKAEYVKVAQDNKEEAIKISSTFRDATMIALAECQAEGPFTMGDYEKRWKFWRSWLYNNWEMTKKDIEETNPF